MSDPSLAELHSISSINFKKTIRDEALRLGFVEVGFLGLEAILSKDSFYQKCVDQYENWLNHGHHGKMEYLKRSLPLKRDPRLLFPSLKSIAVFLHPYLRTPPENPSGLKFARYLYGDDYHTLLKGKLVKVLETAGFKPSECKISVDHSPVLERAVAAAAGLGWIGKNSMLIHPRHGSYTFIASIFFPFRLEDAEESLHKDYCGQCTRCMEGCPTQAIEAPRVLNSQKCISYQTLEEKSLRDPADSIRKDSYVAGCDLCQECCPFNLKPTKIPLETPLGKGSPVLSMPLDQLQAIDENTYKQAVAESALSRIKFPKFQNNIQLAKASKFGDNYAHD